MHKYRCKDKETYPKLTSYELQRVTFSKTESFRIFYFYSFVCSIYDIVIIIILSLFSPGRVRAVIHHVFRLHLQLRDQDQGVSGNKLQLAIDPRVHTYNRSFYLARAL